MPLNRSGRLVTMVAVANGTIYRHRPEEVVWTAPTNNSSDTPALNAVNMVYSAANGQKMYFADGEHYVYYDTLTDTVEDWEAGDELGELPEGYLGNKARLICTWQGRTVLSSIKEEPFNWFMSRINNPADWQYNPTEEIDGIPVPAPDPAQAIAGNFAPLSGQIGDMVVSLCPWSDDHLIFFCDHSIYVMSGNPMMGGSINLITDAVGGVYGICWARDPYGTVYFVSNAAGIYALRVGQQPQRISQAIDPVLYEGYTQGSVIRLQWNDTYQGLDVYMTDGENSTAVDHWFFEQRTGGWWKQRFSSRTLDPLACVIYDGEENRARIPLVACRDGYVRGYSSEATTDDGHVIESEVVIGPLTTKDLDKIMLWHLQAVLGENSGDVGFEVYVGKTAEAALENDPVYTGTWRAGRNFTNPVKKSGYAVYIKIAASTRWQMEQIRAAWGTLGAVQRRGA